MKRTAPRRLCRGITLVELLLTITAMLLVAGVAWEAGSRAVVAANNTRVALEITRLKEGIDSFCLFFGDYPPDFHDQVAVRKFVKQRFPKCPIRNYPDFAAQSPASALYFWLAGPDGRGFSSNPENPFERAGVQRIGPFFAFTPDRLKRVDGVMEYFPPRRVNGDPYVYFRGGKKGYDGHGGWGAAKPYRDSKNGKWIDPQTFQILCAGNDGKLGSGNHYPDGGDYDEFNYDDLASFTTGSTMRQTMPTEAKE